MKKYFLFFLIFICAYAQAQDPKLISNSGKFKKLAVTNNLGIPSDTIRPTGYFATVPNVAVLDDSIIYIWDIVNQKWKLPRMGAAAVSWADIVGALSSNAQLMDSLNKRERLLPFGTAQQFISGAKTLIDFDSLAHEYGYIKLWDTAFTRVQSGIVDSFSFVNGLIRSGRNIGADYDSPIWNAGKIQGINVVPGAISNGMTILYDSATATFKYGFAAGGSGGSMTYPGAGIPLSTGGAWGTSIANNSGNWNTAFSWGNHAGLYPTNSRFTDSLLNHTTRFNLVTGYLATKFNLSDTAAAFTPYARIETSATGSITMWKSDRALGASSILYDNGTNAGATGTFLAPAMKSATSTHYYSFRVDGNLGMGEVFSDGSYIQRMTIAGYHYIQSVNTPINGLFFGTYPSQTYINLKNNRRMSFNYLGDIAQMFHFAGSGKFTDTLFAKTLENLDDSSDVAATTKWVKQQLYGTGSGSGPSDTAHVIVDTTLNAMAKVISVDSLRFKSIAFQINGVTKNPVKTDSTLLWNFPIDSSDIANFSVKVRSLFSATGPITYSNGKIGIDTAAGKHRSEGYYDTKYQPKLVSGTNIKTVNGNSLLGPGDISISTVVAFDSTYHPIVVFSAGAGFVADTALFTDSTLYGSFYTDQDSFFIDKIVVVMKGQTGDSLGIRLTYNDSININGTHINNGTIPVNSRTTGNVVTIVVNRGIPPLSWLWLKSPTVIVGKKPEYLSVTIIGYRKYIAP